MKVLVTGASGNIGRALSAELAGRAEFKVLGVSRRPLDGMIQADISDREQMQRLIAGHRPDAIVHLAAVLGPECDAQKDSAQRINIVATSVIAELAVSEGVGRVVFGSSSAVYGDRRRHPVDETDAVEPQSSYAQQKVSGEQILESAMNASGGLSRGISLRIFNLFGNEVRDSLVYKLAHSSPDSPVALRAPDDFIRDYVHVADVARALRLALTAPLDGPWTVVNIGSGRPMSSRELAETAGRSTPVYVREIDGPPSYSCANPLRAQDLLGFTVSDRSRLGE